MTRRTSTSGSAEANSSSSSPADSPLRRRVVPVSVILGMGLTALGSLVMSAAAARVIGVTGFRDFATAFSIESIGVSLCSAGISRTAGRRYAQVGPNAKVLMVSMSGVVLSSLVLTPLYLLLPLPAELSVSTAILQMAEGLLIATVEYMRFRTGVGYAALRGLAGQRVVLALALGGMAVVGVGASASSVMALLALISLIYFVVRLALVGRGLTFTLASKSETLEFVRQSMAATVTETLTILRPQLLLLVALSVSPAESALTLVFIGRFFAFGGLPFIFFDVYSRVDVARLSSSYENLRSEEAVLVTLRRRLRLCWLLAVVASGCGLAITVSAAISAGHGVRSAGVFSALAALSGGLGGFGALSNSVALGTTHRRSHVLASLFGTLVGLVALIVMPKNYEAALLFALFIGSLASNLAILYSVRRRTGVVLL